MALPIIAFYILKVRLRRIPVSTNLFWKQIFEEKPPRSLWQNFRHLLSLLLQLLMLLLLVLSIADPYFPWQLLQARRVVLILDNSASMRAEDVAPSRLAAAQTAAREVVEGLRFRDEAAVIVVGNNPEVVVGMTNHIPTLRRAIAGIIPADTPTQLDSAIELGKQLIGRHPHGEVVLFTDGCVTDEGIDPSDPSTLPENDAKKPLEVTSESLKNESDTPKIVYRLFGTDAANIGITQFQVRRSLIDPIGYEALASIKNASDQPVKCRLELTLDDVPIDVLPLELKAGEIWSRSIEKTSLNGGTLCATITQIAAGSNVADRSASVAVRSANEAGGAEDSQSSNEGSSLEDRKSSTESRSDKSNQSFRGAKGNNGGTKGDNLGAKGDTGNSKTLNALKTDDTAWAILPPRKVQNVLIVSPGNLFLQKVFEANPRVKI
jgi:hypothetical protein